jgi:dUTPase
LSEYYEKISSQDSKVYVSEKVFLDNDCPASLLLTVGDTYLRKGLTVKMPSSGIKIPPNKTIVFITKQRVGVPHNVFGMVTGVGTNIFNSGFVSSGKIDSGFEGKLKIAFFNGNEKAVTFKEGELVACCSFWTTEYCIEYKLADYHSDVKPELEETSVLSKWLSWLKNNWYSLLALVISILAIILGVR